jgi:predicted nucleic acid-binding protein
VTGTVVDSNVLLDIFTEDEGWIDWSAAMLEMQAQKGPLYINPIIFAEASVRFESVEAVDAALPAGYYRRVDLPWGAAFLAGKAFLKYRDRGGTRPSPMPDFYIGAHAAIAGLTLLTRDALRYREYFPTLRLIAP